MRRTIQKAATSLLLIVIVAMGARIAFAWNQVRKIQPEVLGNVPFQNEAGNIAYSLAEGKGFGGVFRTGTGPTAWLAPVYPLLVGAIFRICGIFTARAFFACVGLNILFSSAACVPIFFVGKRISGLWVASGAAWLWALFPNAILMPFEWIWDTSLSAFLAASLLWATVEIAESDQELEWCGYGFLWGIALMTNPALGALLPFLLGWAAYRGRGESRLRRKRAALAAGVAVLCCVPWTIRNYVAFHRLIPLRSNLPFELWLGNNDIFDEHAQNGRRVITRTEEARRYTQIGETAYMQEKWSLATSFVKTHPGLEVRLAGRKFAAFWLGTESPVRNFRETESGLIRGILLASFLTGLGALFGIVALGIGRKKITPRAARGKRRRPDRVGVNAERRGGAERTEELHGSGEQPGQERRSWVFPLAVFPLIFPCLYCVTHADLRYRHPIDPVVCLLTAMAVGAALELFGVTGNPGARKDALTR